MDLKVRFRFNKATGEVECFDVVDQGGQRLPDAEHNRIHDQATARLGNLIERSPRIVELVPGSPEPPVDATRVDETDGTVVGSGKNRDNRRNV